MDVVELFRISTDLDALERLATDTFRNTPYSDGPNKKPWENPTPTHENPWDAVPDLDTKLKELERRVAMEFGTKAELDSYLDDHPNADKKNHSVRKDPGDKAKDEPSKGAISDFVNKHLSKARNLHEQIKEAPNSVQYFLFDSAHRKEVLARSVKAIKEAPSKAYNKAVFIVKDEINEKVVGFKAAKKLLNGEDITKEEREALVESVRDVTVTVFLGLVTGGVAALPGTLALGFAQGVAIRMVHDSIDKLNDVKDTTMVGGIAGKTLLDKGAPIAKVLLKLMKLAGTDPKDELSADAIQRIIAMSIVASIVEKMDTGFSDEEVVKALQSYSDSLG